MLLSLGYHAHDVWKGMRQTAAPGLHCRRKGQGEAYDPTGTTLSDDSVDYENAKLPKDSTTTALWMATQPGSACRV